jgi:D-glycero-D-manno-heptose 1,7-bisphosphate phosphatase
MVRRWTPRLCDRRFVSEERDSVASVPCGLAGEVALVEPRPCAFLDRDGVLNVDKGHVHTRHEFEWIPGARHAVRMLNEAGFLVVVVTNQSGIGRGWYSEGEFHALMRWMNAELAKAGARIDAVYFCPHHPTEAVGGYRVQCECRKPNPGMLLKAIQELQPDVERSFLIGDSESDMQAAAAAGVLGVLYQGGDLTPVVAEAIAASARGRR